MVLRATCLLHSDKSSGSVGQAHREVLCFPPRDSLCAVLRPSLMPFFFPRLPSMRAHTMSVVTLGCSLGYHCDPRPCPDIHDRMSRSRSLVAPFPYIRSRQLFCCACFGAQHGRYSSPHLICDIPALHLSQWFTRHSDPLMLIMFLHLTILCFQHRFCILIRAIALPGISCASSHFAAARTNFFVCTVKPI